MLRIFTQTKTFASRVFILQSSARYLHMTLIVNGDGKDQIKVPTTLASLTELQSGALDTSGSSSSEDTSFFSKKAIDGSDNSGESLLQKANESKRRSQVEEELERAKLHEMPTPKALKRHLDEYIIGQDTTKKIISVALYKHQFIQQLSQIEKKYEATQSESLGEFLKSDPELDKSNILLVGPSGSGKTLIAKTLAKLLKVPISITDCTSLTQAGFVGEDCESCIEKLLVNSNYDVELCQRGIVVLDEIDKLAKPAVFSGTKDIAGEGVQQGLLKLIEGANVVVKVKNYLNSNSAPKSDRFTEQHYIIDTSNILFISMGAFVGLDQIISQRFRSATTIGFDDDQSSTLDKDETNKDKTSTISEGEEVAFQNDITRLPDEELKSSAIAQVRLANGNKISALQLVSPIDLQKFGLIPELIGRLPILTALDPLSIENLVQISTEPKNSIIKQYEYFFNKIGVRLAITNEAIKKIAKISILNGTGARGLRTILEKILLTVNYDCPGSGISFVLIDKEVIDRFEKNDGLINGEISQDKQEISAKYYSRGEIFKFLSEVGIEDQELTLIIENEYNIPKTSSNKMNATG